MPPCGPFTQGSSYRQGASKKRRLESDDDSDEDLEDPAASESGGDDEIEDPEGQGDQSEEDNVKVLTVKSKKPPFYTLNKNGVVCETKPDGKPGRELGGSAAELLRKKTKRALRHLARISASFAAVGMTQEMMVITVKSKQLPRVFFTDGFYGGQEKKLPPQLLSTASVMGEALLGALVIADAEREIKQVCLPRCMI